jgi:molybdopterin synthase catalytic subunit
MINKVKGMPAYQQVGMIASHLGVVRGSSLDGKAVRGMEVSFDQNIIDKITKETKNIDGIINVLVEVNEGILSVGDEVMAVVVGGDTREHVFPALIAAVDRLKTEATKKKEIFSPEAPNGAGGADTGG